MPHLPAVPLRLRHSAIAHAFACALAAVGPLPAQAPAPPAPTDFAVTAYGHDPTATDPAFYRGPRRIAGADTLARLHLERGNADSAVLYAERLRGDALEIGDSLARRRASAEALDLLGRATAEKGLHEAALGYHARGLQDFRPPLDSGLYWAHALGLAEAHRALRNAEATDEAHAELARARERGALATDTALLLRYTLARAALDINRARFGAADAALDGARVLLSRKPDPRQSLRVAFLDAVLAQVDGREAEARDLLVPVVNDARALGAFDHYQDAVLALGRSYLLDEQPEAAQVTLNTALVNAYGWDNLGLQAEALDLLRLLEYQQGDLDNAYALMTQREAVRRRLEAEQDAEAARRLEAEFQTARREREIDQLEAAAAQRRTRQRYLLTGFAILLVPVVAFLYTFYQKIQREAELSAARAAVDAQDAERARIGAQLHDMVGGNLAAVKLQLARASAPAHETAPLLEALDQTYGMVRDLSHDLVPARFRESGLTVALRQHLSRLSGPGAPEFEFVAHPETAVNALPERTQAELFAISQELLANTLKHARATYAELSLNLADARLTLIYADDGRGFDPQTAAAGIGLRNLRNRAAALGATLDVHSVPGRGATFTLEAPV